ncbi:MAG: hypothetical protein IJA77_07795 [Clostridia bacterium]|nr:hypothetical protein [Clostridia bacterium]
MKTGWRIALYALAAVLVVMGVLVLTGVRGPGKSDVTVTREDDLYSLGMSYMSGEQSATYTLAAGDAIDVTVVHISGDLRLRIACGADVIYEGHNPEMGDFRVNILKDGEYTITVTGRRADGSVSFEMIRAEAKEE